MENETFSSRVKSALREIQPKRGCCRKTDAMLADALTYPSDANKAISCADRFLCPECAVVYMRRCFIELGTVTDPNKSYHLEMSFIDEILRDKACEVLEELDFLPKKGTRRDRFTLYFKNSEAISDFLACIGASDAVFEMINLKLMKEATIGINRQNNFETANLKKTVKANVVYIQAVKYLIESGNFDNLPDDVRETARLRIDNDTASMAELGRLHSPSISKSGVKHRLDRLARIADDIKKRNKK